MIFLNEEMLCHFQGSFLIRDPAYTLPSYYKMKPDFVEEEGGVIALHKAWQILVAAGEETPIIDAIDIQQQPENTIGAWCDAVGIVRNTDALIWEKGVEESWSSWPEFVDTVKKSTGFQAPPKAFPVVPNERVAKMIDSVRPLYQEMESHKLVVNANF